MREGRGEGRGGYGCTSPMLTGQWVGHWMKQYERTDVWSKIFKFQLDNTFGEVVLIKSPRN